MIAGSPWSPGKAFVDYAASFMRSWARGNFGEALGGLDAYDSQTRRSREKLMNRLGELAMGSVVSDPSEFVRSASPTLKAVDPENEYLLKYPVPLDGKWSDIAATFRFVRKAKTGYFRVILVSIDASAT